MTSDISTPLTMPTQIAKTPQTPVPAIDLPLSGQFLIEASAGTGKTWTLTGIVLRLLVEAGYSCEKIIATTFTRSAAADIQTRIRERLTDFMQILALAQQAMATMASRDTNKNFLPSLTLENYGDIPTDTSQVAIFLATIERLAHEQGQRLIIEKEPVYWHLLTWLANQQFPDTQPSPETSLVTLSMAQYRCRTALNQLDKLYVGTLDSLCQKWLREFSAETGYQPDIQITTNSEPLIKSVLHDQIRAFQEAIYTNDRLLYDKLQASQRLPKVEDYYIAVEKALTFYTAPIDDVPVSNYDLANITSLVEKINQADTTVFDNYLNSGYRDSQGMSKTPALYKQFECWKNIRWLLIAQAAAGVWRLSEEEQKWLNSLSETIYQNKHFKKGFDKPLNAFQSLEIAQLLAELAIAIEQANQKSESIRQYFTQFISQYVRQQLPILLESKRQTTFSLQLARLNQALASKQGDSLARYIRHQYPVALIDESQDINTEQAMLLQKIYLSDKKPPANVTANASSNAKTNGKDKTDTQTKTPRQFLLLVGDPKQAIYGFRGGDVVNYTQLKRQFAQANIYELTQNHRSSAALVNGLNHWFGFSTYPSEHPPVKQSPEPELAQDAPYFLGDSIMYRPITAHRQHSLLTSCQPSLIEPAEKVSNASQNVDERHTSPAIFLLHTDVLNQQNLVTHEAMQAQLTQALVTENAAIPLATNTFKPKSITTAVAIAAQILALFDTTGFNEGNGVQVYQYEGRPLQFADIGILATSHRLLDDIERQLHHQNIPTMRGGNQSLFAGEMAQMLVILMNTLIYPQHIARLKRLLMTPLFGLNLSQVEQLLQQDNTDNPNDRVLKNSPKTTFTDIQNSLSNTNKLWQKQGFLSALQSWLDISLQLTDEHQPINFWQRLATQSTGERLLIDLRHLMDVISQYTKGMGEHQILDWLSLMVSEQPKEEWSTQQRLSSEDGVQLMTMHTAKGLEFPIVFAVGLEMAMPPDTKAKSTPALYLYNASSIHSLMDSSTNSPQILPTYDAPIKAYDLLRRLSPRAYFTNEAAAEYKKIEKQAEYEDRLRLAYVALTRAKDRLYITASTPSDRTSSQQTTPLCRWLDPKTLTVPKALSPVVSMVNINSLSKNLFTKNTNHTNTNKSVTNTTTYQNWIAHITQTQFKGWSNTSFTALTHHLNQDQIANATSEPDYASIEESLEPELGSNIGDTLDDWIIMPKDIAHNALSSALTIRFGFEKGARAGTFLHHILENLMDDTSARLSIADGFDGTVTVGLGSQMDWQPNAAWSHIIDKAVKEAQLSPDLLSRAEENTVNQPLADESISHLTLARWLHEVMLTPLGASGICLQQIPKSQKLAELGFNMSLQADFSLENLQKLFDVYQIALNFTLNQPQNQYWRYLKGEIDLVYQHEGRFYIVDYKSNWLGENFAAYHENALRQTMTAHGYWLQASIYQVALHRYLSLRLPNYDINTHLGAVEYAFIRGMSPSLPEYGKLVWQPDSDFILALDKVLGKAVT